MLSTPKASNKDAWAAAWPDGVLHTLWSAVDSQPHSQPDLQRALRRQPGTRPLHAHLNASPPSAVRCRSAATASISCFCSAYAPWCRSTGRSLPACRHKAAGRCLSWNGKVGAAAAGQHQRCSTRQSPQPHCRAALHARQTPGTALWKQVMQYNVLRLFHAPCGLLPARG